MIIDDDDDDNEANVSSQSRENLDIKTGITDSAPIDVSSPTPAVINSPTPVVISSPTPTTPDITRATPVSVGTPRQIGLLITDTRSIVSESPLRNQTGDSQIDSTTNMSNIAGGPAESSQEMLTDIKLELVCITA